MIDSLLFNYIRNNKFSFEAWNLNTWLGKKLESLKIRHGMFLNKNQY
jgi:hypothetical protein